MTQSRDVNIDKNNLTVLQINLQHSYSATLQLQKTIEELKPDIVLLQEPYVNKFCKISCVPYSYKCFSKIDTDKKFFCAAVLVKNSLKADVHHNLSSNECVTVSVYLNSRTLTFCSVYCPPSVQRLTDNISCLDKVRHFANYVVGGDFNAKSPLWLSNSQTDKKGKELEDFFASKSLLVVNDPSETTYGLRNTTSPDVTAVGTNLVQSVRCWKVLDEYPSLSDHSYILFTLEFNFPIFETEEPRYIYKKTKWDTFSATLLRGIDDIYSLPMSSVEEIDCAANEIKNLMQKATKESTPLKNSHKQSKYARWWNQDLTDLRKKYRHAQRVYKRLGTVESEQIKNQTHLDYKTKILAAKKEDWKKFCEEKASLDPWNTINKICKLKGSATLPVHILKQDGSMTDSPKEAGEQLLGKWFSSDDNSNDSVAQKLIRNETENISSENQDKMEPITMEILQDVIKSIKPMKAPGPDGIMNFTIKKNINVLSPTLLKLFNSCLKTSYFPVLWKQANIIVILKKGKTNDGNPGSYRPISLLSNIGKIFERIIMNRLDKLSLDNCWVSKRQFGFCKGKSTIDAVDNMVSVIEKNKEEKKFTLCLFFDIKGAFDNAWHPGILKKLKDKKCPIQLLRLVKSFLSDRTVSYGKDVSRKLEKSCPQGSILSPFLWLININDLLEMDFGENCTIQAYADDVTVILTGKNILFLENLAEKIFQKFEVWAAENKLTFDQRKTEAVLFTNKHKVPVVNLFFGGEKINIQQKVRYLGIILDRKLLWTDHVSSRVTAAKQYSTRLLCAAKMTWGLKPQALRKLYKSVIESTVLYGVSVWFSALRKKNILQMLQSAQRTSMIIISKSFRSAQNDVITAIAGVLPISFRATELATLRYAKKGRPSHWPNFTSPEFPLSKRSSNHSTFTDESLVDILGLSTVREIHTSTFHINRKALKNILYGRWYEEFKNKVSSWSIRFFASTEDLLAVCKVQPSYHLTQIITGHCRLNFFLHRINKIDTELCLCGVNETCSHFLFECPIFVRERLELIFHLNSINVPFPFNLDLIFKFRNVRNILLEYIRKTKRLDLGL